MGARHSASVVCPYCVSLDHFDLEPATKVISFGIKTWGVPQKEVKPHVIMAHRQRHGCHSVQPDFYIPCEEPA
jgi:hypothetical protein